MRKITNINSGWLFSKDAEKVPNVLPDNWQEVDLPHTWNGDDGQDGGNDYYRGTCYYAKELDGSLFDEGKVNYLEFRGRDILQRREADYTPRRIFYIQSEDSTGKEQ